MLQLGRDGEGGECFVMTTVGKKKKNKKDKQKKKIPCRVAAVPGTGRRAMRG